MDKNEIKQKLHSYRYILFKIEAANDKLNDLAAMMDTHRNIKSTVLTGMPSTNNVSDPVADSVTKIIDIYCKEYAHIENELDKLFKEKHEIDDLIILLDGMEKQIIELKYFKKYKWWMVAQTMNYSETQCRRICLSALEKIKEKGKNT